MNFEIDSEGDETKAELPVVVGLSDLGPWSPFFGGSTPTAGPSVTPTSAMGVPAVAAAVGLIAGAIGSLPVKIYTDNAAGSRTEAPDHPAYALVHDDANEWTSAGHLRGQLVTDSLLRGNGFGLVRRDADGVPYEILRLDPGAVSILRDENTGEPWFKLQGQSTPIHHADVIHIPAPCSLDGITGIATIQRARDTISLAIALERHASRIFSKGARPSGVLMAPEIKSAAGASKLATGFGVMHSDENSGKPAVLYAGVKWEATEFKTVDLQFMEMRAFQIGEIAKAFNVPPTLIGELAKATLSNSEQMGRQFLQMTLLPWINTIRAAYRRALISPADRKTYSIDFVTDGLLQADSAQRAAFYASLRASGTMTANECRRLENLPDRPDGDSLTSPHIATGAAPALEIANV
jgi:HK97 family phage portal protein